MLRWRNWKLKYVGVQDRALKLCPDAMNTLNRVLLSEVMLKLVGSDPELHLLMILYSVHIFQVPGFPADE